MSIPYILLSVLYVVGCICLIVMILMQKKRTAGLSGMSGMGTSQTYWDKNKGRSLEGTLEKYSKIGGAVFFIFTIILCVVR